MQIPDVSSIFSEKVSEIKSSLPAEFGDFADDYSAAVGQTAEQTAAPATPAQTQQTAAPVVDDPAADAQAQQVQASGSGSVDFSGAGSAVGGTGGIGTGSTAGTIGPATAQSLGDLLASLQPAASTGGGGVGQSAAEYAQQFVGTPYVWGGEDLVKGTDCSGFTQSVYKKFGISLARTAYGQSKQGVEVSVEDLQPGDLLCYKTADYAPVTHVGMYIGDGKFVHASSAKEGVIISSLDEKWLGRLVTARRVTSA